MNGLVYFLRPGRSQQTLRSTMAAIRPWILAAMWLALSMGIIISLSLVRPEPALAQGGSTGMITHTKVADFGAVCSLLTGTTVSSAAGGEIRLAATLEDYFDDTLVDNTLWRTGFVYDSYTAFPPTEDGNLLNLDGSYVRSQISFTHSIRFFEARARTRTSSPTQIPWADLGFYRQKPPFSYTGGITEASAIRLFVDGNDAGQPTTDQNGVYVLARDGGDSATLYTKDIEPDPNLTQFHNFRLVWNNSETRYYIDGVLGAVISPSATALPSWAFLYAQDPGNLIQIDWVRAGHYASNGAYLSCTQDAGEIVNWTTLSATVETPTGTSVTFNTRTSLDGVNWSGWSPVSGSDIPSPSGRYFQYRAALSTSNPSESPEVQAVIMSYSGPSSLVVTPGPAVLDPGAAQQFNAQVVDDNSDPISGLSIGWQVVNGGGLINSAGLFTAGLAAGAYANTVQASSVGLTGTATVVVNNLSPDANPGGPYTGNENQPVSLDGAGSSDPNNDPLDFAWDLDNDGQFDDAAGSTPAYTWPADGGYIIGLRVTDSGGLSDTITTTVAISNLATIYLPIIIR